jgi:hypothetical protein
MLLIYMSLALQMHVNMCIESDIYIHIAISWVTILDVNKYITINKPMHYIFEILCAI